MTTVIVMDATNLYWSLVSTKYGVKSIINFDSLVTKQFFEITIDKITLDIKCEYLEKRTPYALEYPYLIINDNILLHKIVYINVHNFIIDKGLGP